MKRLLLCLFLLGVVGCWEEQNKTQKVYFSGEIVNPTSEYVVLYKDDQQIDSARLNSQNRFVFELDTLEEGLHNFKHSPEYQYVYLEKGDSLVIRLNTTDFDESLVFAGVGEEINNFLLEMFLTNEEEDAYLISSYSLEPGDFTELIDSLRNVKLAMLKSISADADISEEAREMAEASIDYNYYVYKEMYPFYHKRRMGDEKIPDLGKDFYEYRASLDLNNENLTYFRPYYKFINYHLGNLTYMQCLEHCEGHGDTKESYLHFNRHKLGLIDSLITEKELRDNVFRHVAIDYLLKVQDNEKNNRLFIEEFHSLSANNRHMKEIDNLYQGILNIQPRKELPELKLLNSQGELYSLKEIAKDRNAVFYFWTATQRAHFDNVANRVKQLAAENPDYTFVGISFNTDTQRWKALIRSKELDSTLQYRADDFEALTNSLIIYPMNKAVITRDSIIVDAFANLYTSF